MSYILEALKKSEKERELGRVPTIKTVHYSDGATFGTKKRSWLPIAAVLVTINMLIGGLVYWWVRPGEGQVPTATLPPAAETTFTSPEDVPSEAIEGEQNNVAMADQEEEIAIEDADDNTAYAEDEDVAIAEVPMGESNNDMNLADANSEDPSADMTAVIPDATNTSSTAVTESSAPMNGVVQNGDDATLNTDEQYPLLTALDPTVQRSIPQLSINVHVYAENARERFVFINMAKVREGSTVANGVKLHEITPEGVILSFHNQYFRMPRP